MRRSNLGWGAAPASKATRGKAALCTTTALVGGTCLAIVSATLTLPHPALANPEGGVVSDGAATIQHTAPGRLDILQSTSKAVIDWQRFGIKEGEHTNFRQPDAAAITLNRVTGPDPSAILGRLTANGQVWLVNPNGILFGPNASVDVGGLVATTHDIRNEDFMAGRHSFEGRAGSTATVENEGTITVAEAGLAALVAPGVANRGTIQARMGEVTLASGRRFVVDLFGDQKINIAVDTKTDARPVGADGKPVDALVSNSGRIFADGGRVQMTASAAKGLVDRVVNMSGTVQARRVEQQGGDIVLLGDGGEVEVSGTLDASGNGAGQTGGSVTVSGNRTALAASARVTASGAAGGGEVLIGGDVQGGKASAATLAGYTIRPARKPVPPSTETVVAQGATIATDAAENGKGGKVVVWADGSTRFDGAISARGGAAGGDGGFVETSGKLSLQVRGRVDAGAAAGKGGSKGGSWLLDPTDIRVSSNGGTISAGMIEASLNTGTDVTLQTDSAVGGNGDITVDDAIEKTAGGNATLTLEAYRNILINATITSTAGRLNLDLKSGSNLTEDAQGGVVWFDGTSASPISVSTNGGYLRIGGARYMNSDPDGPPEVALPARGPDGDWGEVYRHGVQLTNTTIDTAGGAIDISGQGGGNLGGVNYGIHLTNSALTSGHGSITLKGRGGNDREGFSDNPAIVMDTSTLSTADGSIALTGVSPSMADGNDAMRLTDVTISSSGSGSISLIGPDRDILLTGTRLSSASGSVVIRGTGNANLRLSDNDDSKRKSLIEAGTSVTLEAGGDVMLIRYDDDTLPGDGDAGHKSLVVAGTSVTLKAGAAATLTRNTGAPLSGDGDTDNTPVIRAGTSLSLEAEAGLALNRIGIIGTQSIALKAGEDLILTNSTLQTSAGPVIIASATTPDGSYGGAIILDDSTITTAGGAITLGGGAIRCCPPQRGMGETRPASP